MALLEARDISKIYKTGPTTSIQVLYDISLTIDQGEFLSITGKSGSGKSTLMHILGCLDTPTRGEYYVEQHDVAHMNSDQLAHIRNSFIGFVFQRFHLLPDLTAQENVALPHLYAEKHEQESMQRAAQLLAKLGLEQRMNHYPNELSGGEQQRVAIARALINDPAIILADEPTGNLDSATGKKIMELFSELNKKNHVTIIIVTHDPVLAAQTNRIITLLDGRLVDDKKQGAM